MVGNHLASIEYVKLISKDCLPKLYLALNSSAKKTIAPLSRNVENIELTWPTSSAKTQ